MDILGLDRAPTDDYDLPMLNLLVLMDSVEGRDQILRHRVLAHWESSQDSRLIPWEDEGDG